MSDEWKLGIGVHDTFDRDWALCRDYSNKSYKAWSGTKEELIQKCIQMNIKANYTKSIILGNFSDHYGVIEYQLGEHGLISRLREVWCPYSHKTEFGELIVVPKENVLKVKPSEDEN